MGTTGTPVAGTTGRLIKGSRMLGLEAMYSSSLSYSTGLFAALMIRASKNIRPYKTTISYLVGWRTYLHNLESIMAGGGQILCELVFSSESRSQIHVPG